MQNSKRSGVGRIGTFTRRSMFALSGGVALAGLAACTGGSSPATPGGSAATTLDAQYRAYPSILTTADTGKSVTFWGWDTLAFNKPIEDYVKSAAGVSVTDTVIPNADILNKIKLATLAKTLPDVFKSGTGDIPALVQMGAVQDITDLVAPYRKELPDIGWNQVTYNGKIYGIPANSPAGGMFYRQDVLTKYGIDPASLTTWDKYIAAAQKLSADSGGKVNLFGYQQALSIGMQMTAINLNHAQLLDKDMNVAVSPSSPEWQATMALIKKLSAPGVGKDVPEWSPEWYQAMKDGSLASFPEGTWFLSTIQQQAPDTKGDWNFQPFPAVVEGGDRYVDFGSTMVAISSQTKNRGAGFELAKAWSIDPEGSLGIGLEKLGISVVCTAALTSDYVNKPQEWFANNQPYWKDATEAYSKITFSPAPTTANAQALTIFGTDLAQFQAGQSADAFLTKLAADLKEQIKGVK